MLDAIVESAIPTAFIMFQNGQGCIFKVCFLEPFREKVPQRDPDQSAVAHHQHTFACEIR
jgi:hypothetical protein